MHRLSIGFVVLVLVASSHAEERDAVAAKQGRAVFDEAVAWMRGKGPAFPAVTRAHLLFKDVKIDDEQESGRHHEGHLEIWFAAPSRFREEWRTSSRDTKPTIKVLDGQKAWIKTPGSAKWRPQHGRGDGAKVIAQLKRDVKQLADLARFLSPVSLDGKGVTWTLEGPQRLAPPLATQTAPAFTRVRRVAPGEPAMLFFFAAHEPKSGPSGRYPYAIGIQGDATTQQRQEWFVLDRWRRMPNGHAQPARIQGFAPSAAGALRRFILLFPDRVELNPTLAESVFRPQ